MLDLNAFVQAMLSDQLTNWAITLVILLPAVQWTLGICRAVADSKFQLDLIDVFLRKVVAGRVIPLIILLLLGRFIAVGAPGALNIPGLDLSVLTGAGLAFSAPFLLAVINSIVQSVNPSTPAATPTPE